MCQKGKLLLVLTNSSLLQSFAFLEGWKLLFFNSWQFFLRSAPLELIPPNGFSEKLLCRLFGRWLVFLGSFAWAGLHIITWTAQSINAFFSIGQRENVWLTAECKFTKKNTAHIEFCDIYNNYTVVVPWLREHWSRLAPGRQHWLWCKTQFLDNLVSEQENIQKVFFARTIWLWRTCQF